MAILCRPFRGVLTAAVVASPISAVAFEFVAERAYSCPNGIALYVTEVGPDHLVTIGPGRDTETRWTMTRLEAVTTYHEEGFLAFFSLVLQQSAADFTFVTPDGPVTGCR